MGIGHNKAKILQKWICKHREVSYGVEILLGRLCDKRFHKFGIKPIGGTKVWKLMSSVKKPRGNYMNEFNPCGDQTTHFVSSWMEIFNDVNFACNHKRQVPHFKHDQQYVYHRQVGEKQK
jgi:hypothetical protein